jgi:imidazolonepropionase-like amidohydrolase
MNSAFPTVARKFIQLRASGIPLAMATDSGSPAHFHRDAIWWELRAWRDHGASVNEALTAATTTGARALHDDAIGRIRLGGRADFVLYRGNLQEGDLDSSRIVTVAKGGVLYVSKGEWVGPAPP